MSLGDRACIIISINMMFSNINSIVVIIIVMSNHDIIITAITNNSGPPLEGPF